MLHGIDVSHHNYNRLKADNAYSEFLKDKVDFVICKATEGKTYVDANMHDYPVLFPSALLGFYHYARPENNSAADEVANFVSAVKPYLGGAIFALDVEGDALSVKNLDAWCLEWCNGVYQSTGVKPLIYASSSTLSKFPSLAKNDYGLWVADWNGKITVNKSRIKPWSFWAIHQYAVIDNLDYDIFNGTEEAWGKYASQ